jgi:hypothetical protein
MMQAGYVAFIAFHCNRCIPMKGSGDDAFDDTTFSCHMNGNATSTELNFQ